MFQQSFHQRVDKHLNVFQKAVQGLIQVRKEIGDEINDRKINQLQLADQIKNHEKEITAMAQHSDQIESTISKINVLLPQSMREKS